MSAKPHTFAAIVLLFISLWSFANSFAPLRPLHTSPGFEEATNFLAPRLSDPKSPAWVMVWPPEQNPSLPHLPASLRATDAVPMQGTSPRPSIDVWLLSPAKSPAPPELDETPQISSYRFGDVELRLYSTGRAP